MRITTTDKEHITTFIHACIRNGMTHVVCSPGSRNASIIIAIDEHPALETIVVHDERSAAFYALGMAQELKSPVGLVCTSGSAMLNYYPAVAEAFYQCIPIVVMSADRPSEWVNHGDGQTIVQEGAYTNHIRYEASISKELDEAEIKSEVNRAFEAGLKSWKGPIHFNLPLEEPLYGKREIDWNKEEVIENRSERFTLESSVKAELREIWENSPRKMILIGQHDKDLALQNGLFELCNDNSIAVLVESTSNLKHQRWVHCIDRTLSGISDDEIERFQPDLLITFGGAIISKRIKLFLRKAPVKSHWKIGHDFPEMNTYRKLTHSIELGPAEFVHELLSMDLAQNASNFGSTWKQRDFLNQEKLPAFFETIPYSDMSVFETVLDYIPENAYLHMANSSVVRYCQLYDPIPSLRYFANRGTSGIDGSTSTACGVALSSPTVCNVLLTGDVSFFYDSNAFWNNQLPSNLRVFLINNGGGGIFRIIPGPRESDQLERYFEAQHDRKAEFICKAHDVNYMSASSLSEIESQMADFFEESDRPKLMEIFTPRELNGEVLAQYFEFLK
ncbi:MAG: 2-succinyl-5-enolpyruvyl-6-hydroxy-3-cyclohexene-1-carboxylic-acid synthase [Crocinitomicaceae bacterium]|nr:2-succinyl-5-enolpyruvyl-6-hydroxy-3-cyclohexene-1-carboxylic-acid synthase [Flavobacteriales bacterium]NQZ37524.1 2-succinyl-5-enolpyruvyl-6-hydroxy-3-cyclohexene-1-carboxylic-acid synthase [Crocinitomicaceae bacterium]